MSRAHSIWIVRTHDHALLAAFTVKHELDTWLTRTYAPHGERTSANCPVLIDRVGDGGTYLRDNRPVAINPNTLNEAI
jgi:hypothetical protein